MMSDHSDRSDDFVAILDRVSNLPDRSQRLLAEVWVSRISYLYSAVWLDPRGIWHQKKLFKAETLLGETLSRPRNRHEDMLADAQKDAEAALKKAALGWGSKKSRDTACMVSFAISRIFEWNHKGDYWAVAVLASERYDGTSIVAFGGSRESLRDAVLAVQPVEPKGPKARPKRGGPGNG